MNYSYIIIALLAGAVFAIQPGVNENLGRYFNHPIQASFVSFLVGTLLLLLLNFGLGLKFPSTEKLGAVAWWLWLAGGAIGAFVVTAALTIQPKIGAGVWISSFIFGQLVMSVLLDNYGWLGLTVHPLNSMRALGVFLLALGAMLIAFY
ncbi:MAG: DMT family transporter [Cyanobacteria bacterium J06623_7]